MNALSNSMPAIQSLTCWEPQFDLSDLSSLRRVRRLTLLRLPFNDAVVRQVKRNIVHHCKRTLNHFVLNQVLRFVEESGRRCAPLEKMTLEFVLQDEYGHGFPLAHQGGDLGEFDLAKVFDACGDSIKVFTVEFKDSSHMMTRPVGYNNTNMFGGGGGGGRFRQQGVGRSIKGGAGMANLVHVQVF